MSAKADAKQLRSWKRTARARMKRGEFLFVLDDGAWLDPCTMTRGPLDKVQKAWIEARRRLLLDAEEESTMKAKTKKTKGADEDAGSRYADAYVLPDGTVHEYGGQGRTWASEAAYHEARGWRAGALFFPVNGQRRDAEARGAG